MNEPNPMLEKQTPRLGVMLTPAQVKALLGFLQRASLTGREVAAYTELFNLIAHAKPESPL